MVNENSKAYQLWKSYHGISYFEEHYGSKLLFYNWKSYKYLIDNISFKDFGEIQYLSWTEASNSFQPELKIIEIYSQGGKK
jgi:hypothetical protein